ncbi:MAG: helix-turn-helix domain-containing protein [Oscillospiraceae bacterium]|nr:helix-turn-helix domain-containing protein [Oscillospiraceae bacterium]
MYIRRLYDLRIDNDLSQQEVADFLVCHRQAYGRYERGFREIPVSMLIKLAKYYGVSTDYILGLSDEK